MPDKEKKKELKQYEKELTELRKLFPALELTPCKSDKELKEKEQALKEGMINSRSDLLFPKFYFSASIDSDLLRNRIQAFNKQYGRRNVRMALVFARRYARLWFGKGH